MVVDFRLPNISATTAEGQQIRSYLIQLTEQLNFAFNSISNNGETMDSYRVPQSASSGTTKEDEANNTFSEIKSLIIKSADVVEHIRSDVDTLFEQSDQYVATSNFGSYFSEQYSKQEAFPEMLKTTFYTKEEIDDSLGKRIDALENDAVFKQGILRFFTAGEYEGVAQYGIEVGQEVANDNGEVVYNKMARLFAEGLELYSSKDSSTPIAMFKYNTMYITNAEISGNLKLGGYNLDTSKGLTFKWVGR